MYDKAKRVPIKCGRGDNGVALARRRQFAYDIAGSATDACCGVGEVAPPKVRKTRRHVGLSRQPPPERWSLPSTVAWLAVLLRSSPGRRPAPRPTAPSPPIRGHIDSILVWTLETASCCLYKDIESIDVFSVVTWPVPLVLGYDGQIRESCYASLTTRDDMWDR